MIEIMPDMPNNIVGITASGQVTKEDYQKILIPALKKALESRDKVRVLYQLGDDFSGMDFGAMWEDMSFGVGHMKNWEKIAVVTNVGWIKHGMSAFRFLMPCPVKVFPNTESSNAKTWITS